MEKLKIAFVLEYYPFGGVETVTHNLAIHLNTQGYTVIIFIKQLFDDRLSDDNRNAIEFIQLPNKHSLKANENGAFITSTINQRAIDICIFQGSMQPYMGAVKRDSCAKIIYCNHGSPFWEASNRIICTRQKAKQSGWFKKAEWYILKVPEQYITNGYKGKYTRKYRKTYNSCDAYVTLCEGYRQELINVLKLDDANNHIYAIQNSSDLNNTYKSEKSNELLYVGRLSYADKRVDRLVDIWNNLYKKHTDWELVIVGEGEQEQALKNKAKEVGVERIRFCGYSNDPGKYYNSAAILCLTSTFEGWGLVLTEAQQAGVVPIAFNCSAGVECVLSPSWENGVLVRPFSIEEYTEQLDKLISSEELRKQMQQNVIEKSKTYRTEIVASQWINLFQALATSK